VKRALFGSFLVSLALAISTPASAETGDKARAKEAYDRGLAAHKKGDLKMAAQEFARADSYAPSPVALQAALDAAVEADDAPLGAELLERSRREPAPPGLAASITAAHLKFSGRTGKVRVACPTSAACTAKLDERSIEVDKVVWTRTGSHTLVTQVDGKSQKQQVEVSSDQLVEVSAVKGGATAVRPEAADTPAPADADADSPRRKRGAFAEGLPPIVFFGGVGLTVVLAGVTTYFAIDTSNAHGDFEKAGCAQANFAPCAGHKADGESSQSMTNVMLALTGVAAVGTAVVGAAFTNWKGPLLSAYPGGGGATWRVAF
jgi:hypothetical protein